MLRNARQTARLRAKDFRSSLSPAEAVLWKALKPIRGELRIRRQFPVDDYVLDFFIPSALLCIEVDGILHSARPERDAQRDERLNTLGIETIRLPAAGVFENTARTVQFIREKALDRIRDLGGAEKIGSEGPPPPAGEVARSDGGGEEKPGQ